MLNKHATNYINKQASVLSTAIRYGKKFGKKFGKAIKKEIIDPLTSYVRLTNREFEEYLMAGSPTQDQIAKRIKDSGILKTPKGKSGSDIYDFYTSSSVIPNADTAVFKHPGGDIRDHIITTNPSSPPSVMHHEVGHTFVNSGGKYTTIGERKTPLLFPGFLLGDTFDVAARYNSKIRGEIAASAKALRDMKKLGYTDDVISQGRETLKAARDTYKQVRNSRVARSVATSPLGMGGLLLTTPLAIYDEYGDEIREKAKAGFDYLRNKITKP
jgi:hypothetical protein